VDVTTSIFFKTFFITHTVFIFSFKEGNIAKKTSKKVTKKYVSYLANVRTAFADGD
jgi:hypothetical protein